MKEAIQIERSSGVPPRIVQLLLTIPPKEQTSILGLDVVARYSLRREASQPREEVESQETSKLTLESFLSRCDFPSLSEPAFLLQNRLCPPSQDFASNRSNDTISIRSDMTDEPSFFLIFCDETLCE